MDGVALASVITSGTLGLAGIVATAREAGKSRTHAKQLAADQREEARRQGSAAAYLELSRWCVEGLRALEPPQSEMHQRLWRPSEIDAQMLIHGTPRVQAALQAVDAAVETENRTSRYERDRLIQAKEKAIDAMDFEAAANLRHQEVQMLDAMSPWMASVRAALWEVQAAVAER